MSKEMTEIFKRDPYAKLLNMRLVDWKKGYAKTAITLTEDLLNFHHAANGGLLFSLADYAFAVASNSHGQVAVGINTHMAFTNAGKVGEELICIAEEVNKGGRLAVYQMEIRNQEGELKARMEGTVYRMNKQFAKPDEV